jgi:hypothetical protein
MTELKLYKGKKPLVVHPETFLHAMKSIVAAGKEDEFLDAVKDHPEAIEVHPAFANAVKTVLHKNGLHENNPKVAQIVKSPPGTTSCFPKQTA